MTRRDIRAPTSLPGRSDGHCSMGWGLTSSAVRSHLRRYTHPERSTPRDGVCSLRLIDVPAGGAKSLGAGSKIKGNCNGLIVVSVPAGGVPGWRETVPDTVPGTQGCPWGSAFP
jgi:hypothetical protein